MLPPYIMHFVTLLRLRNSIVSNTGAARPVNAHANIGPMLAGRPAYRHYYNKNSRSRRECVFAASRCF